ncbi:bifunctional 4-hydroxy-3-methylbut-2-enyl diphosphate reductase/30S ribosomal protein S1, partial [candidate division KSB1 bacterium]|nr:bifunctional 4-hydroxy-3-methylbut-2-enyl diphosphate reductase/30S ribosomal protein S1 [candidate division KSB1 bacterium]
GVAAGKAVVIEKLDAAILVSGHRPTLVIAQTTTNVRNFEEIACWFQAQQAKVVVENTICRAVTLRHERLREFAQQVDVVLMVGGRASSNTRELVQISQSVNPQTYLIEAYGDIEPHWLTGNIRIGVTGSASTPRWQLEKIHQYLVQNDVVPNPTKI